MPINVVIPVYNEAKTIEKVITTLQNCNFIKTIIVVDDGSTDGSTAIIRRLPNVVALRNNRNRGVGYSISRGLRFSKKLGNVSYTATMDGDGQHSLSDLHELRSRTNKDSLIIHGKREIKRDAPFVKKYTSILAWKTLKILYGITIPDPFCGLNIYNHDIIPYIKLSDGYDWPIQIAKLMQQSTPFVLTVSIPARYSEYSLSKGMTLLTSIRVFWKIVLNRIKEIFNESQTQNSYRDQSILPTNRGN